ncbi:MAG: hypothetical protein SGI77_11750 [Pirellulaceae bacterium]|nr:hypothetical protein [Pirellulaceae bacterium]
MIQENSVRDDVVQQINEVLNRFRSVVDYLQKQETIPSFRTLCQTTPIVREAFDRSVAVRANSRVEQRCNGRINCAIIGSSGNGKTTMLDEMFPGLSERGLLVTDVTDTTSQALHISFADKPDELSEVFVNSWSHPQMVSLMEDDDVKRQNDTDGINIEYLQDRVVIDGGAAKLRDMQSFKFPLRTELRPFPTSYRVPTDKLSDKRFIRALTVKQPSDQIDRGSLVTFDGNSYNALQLRAVVKEVRLKDGYKNILRWSNRAPHEAVRLQFVDTPGISVQGSEKDEVLRHFLGKKSNHIALQMWMNDELDIVVHLVLCGRNSDFAELWRTLEANCEPGQMDDLSERLVLAVNGMNKYFSDKNLIDKYESPDQAVSGGDHFATTIEDNILQKMSPRGRIKPAEICFFDSKKMVEADKRQLYGDYYRSCRPIMETWTEPSGVGYSTLSRLGILESFKENISALVDPDDRGQGFLVRKLFNLVDRRGPYLLVKKFLIRTKVFDEVEKLAETIKTYYDDLGSLNRRAVLDALLSCLQFIDLNDPQSLEVFIGEKVDSAIDEMKFLGAERRPDSWGADAFKETANLLKREIVNASRPSPDITSEFERHFETQISNWSSRWGYDDFRLPAPSDNSPNSAHLMRYCLKLHAREILLRLMAEQESTGDSEGFKQTPEDQKRILQIITWLNEARSMTKQLCASHGVSL